MISKNSGRLLSAIGLLMLGTGVVLAKGGTAKPPPTTTGTPAVLPAPDPRTRTIPAIAPTPPNVTADNNLHQFDITGFVESFDNTPEVACGAGDTPGGHVTVNGINVIIPCNMIVQMPANTLNWQAFTTGVLGNLNPPPIDLATISTTTNPAYPSIEIRVVGNWMDGNPRKYVAALAYTSQQSLNTGSGVISSIDYTTGHILVTTTAGKTVRLEINDPNGRFGRKTQRDDRLKVDDENPTISAATGYPMCVPRTNPATADDALCPKRNRPLAGSCRTFASMGLSTPNAGATTFFQDPLNAFCTAFVMKAHPDTAVNSISAVYPPTSLIAATTEPDARQQAPFVVGDTLNWSGSLMRGVTTAAGATGALAEPIISVHTITANVGIYTQPGTLPVYVRLGEFGLAGDLAPAGGAATIGPVKLPMEVQNRMFVEADVTDITAIVDMYLIDTDPNGLNGLVDVSRWVTPESMTSRNVLGQDSTKLNAIGFQGGLVGTVTYPKPAGFGIEGGIVSQWEGAQIGRARMRATKAAVGLLASPSRNIRAVVRTLCEPDNINTNANAKLAFSTGQTLDAAPPTGLGWKPQLTTQTYLPFGTATTGALVSKLNAGISGSTPATCTGRIVAANGLKTGQYSAPVFEYIFPEGTAKGSPVVPNNFWDYSFLWIGDDSAPGVLNPTPW